VMEQVRAFRSDLQEAEDARNTLTHTLYWCGPVGDTTPVASNHNEGKTCPQTAIRRRHTSIRS
jgi:hypothetical protein